VPVDNAAILHSSFLILTQNYFCRYIHSDQSGNYDDDQVALVIKEIQDLFQTSENY